MAIELNIGQYFYYVVEVEYLKNTFKVKSRKYRGRTPYFILLTSGGREIFTTEKKAQQYIDQELKKITTN